MYKMLPKLHIKENRELIKKFFAIAKKENVLIHPFGVFRFQAKDKGKKAVKQNHKKCRTINKQTV